MSRSICVNNGSLHGLYIVLWYKKDITPNHSIPIALVIYTIKTTPKLRIWIHMGEIFLLLALILFSLPNFQAHIQYLVIQQSESISLFPIIVTSHFGALTKLILWGHLLASDLEFYDVRPFILYYDAIDRLHDVLLFDVDRCYWLSFIKCAVILTLRM